MVLPLVPSSSSLTVSYNTILLGDGQVDQLIEAISPNSIETLTQLGVETSTKVVSLLLIRICVITHMQRRQLCC